MKEDNWSFQISYNDAKPVYRQIIDEIKLLIYSKKLLKDNKLLAIRELASRLKVNSNTIVKVYYQLESQGLLYSRPGHGYFVKYSDEMILNEREEIFKKMVKETIIKAKKMSYSEDDIINEIKNNYKYL